MTIQISVSNAKNFATKFFESEMTPPLWNFSKNSSIMVGTGFPQCSEQFCIGQKYIDLQCIAPLHCLLHSCILVVHFQISACCQYCIVEQRQQCIKLQLLRCIDLHCILHWCHNFPINTYIRAALLHCSASFMDMHFGNAISHFPDQHLSCISHRHTYQ